MIRISYTSMVVFISIIWCLVRVICAIKTKRADWKKELKLLLVYVCIVVVARFTFFPFSKVNGEIQPLMFGPVYTRGWMHTGKSFLQVLVFLYVLRFYSFSFMTEYPILMICY